MKKIHLELTQDEISFLINAIAETEEHLEGPEFSMRTGFTETQAEELCERLMKLRKK